MLRWRSLLPFCARRNPQSQTPSRFAGTWVENESKHKMGTDGGNLTFRRTPAGGLEELRGPEVRPLAQPVNFGTAPYAIDAGKNTIAWKQNGATRFERQLFNSGPLINTRRIQIADDGKKRTSTTVYRRTSGDGPGVSRSVARGINSLGQPCKPAL